MFREYVPLYRFLLFSIFVVWLSVAFFEMPRNQQVLPTPFYQLPKSSTHAKARITRCLFCPGFKTIHQTMWLAARKHRKELHIPLSHTLATKIYEVFPSFNILTKSLPTSVCLTHLRLLNVTYKAKLAKKAAKLEKQKSAKRKNEGNKENHKPQSQNLLGVARKLAAKAQPGKPQIEYPDVKQKTNTSKRPWTDAEIAKIDTQFETAARVQRIKREAGCGSSCQLCSDVWLHNLNEECGLESTKKLPTRKTGSKPINTSKKRRRVSFEHTSSEKNDTTSPEKPQTRSTTSDVSPLTPAADLSFKRRKRTVIRYQENAKKQALTAADLRGWKHDTRASARAIARGADGQRERETTTGSVGCELSGAASRKHDTFLNKAFDEDYVAEELSIAGDGRAYVSKDPAELLRKHVWIRHRCVRSLYFRCSFCSHSTFLQCAHVW